MMLFSVKDRTSTIFTARLLADDTNADTTLAFAKIVWVIPELIELL